MNVSNKSKILKLFVVQTGQTIWEVQDRIESLPGAPLTDDGAVAVSQVADELAACGSGVCSVYACDSESERQTADLVAEAAELLLDQARLAEGEPVRDAAAFGRRLAKVMERSLAAG